ncbi:MAG TPA: DUF721 domain-containing protein [Candidatus Limnocylindrales bacterium]|nr:DUF721 domain-containing protein [Candidatus Limnocylindrales bacterium]
MRTNAPRSSARRVRDLLTAAVPGLSDHMLEHRIQQEWRQLLPPTLARRSRAGTLERGTLEVRVENSPWLHELTMRSGEVLAALTGRYGAAAVTGLRFVLDPSRVDAAAPSPAPPPKAVARPRLHPDEAREIETMTSALPDAELAHVLRRLITKDRLARRQEALLPRAERERP